MAVRQAHRGDDLVDDDERDLAIVRTRQLDPMTLMIGLHPRSDHPAIGTEQRHTSLTLVAFDLNTKHDLTHLCGTSAARYPPLSRWRLLEAARSFLRSEGISNIELVVDDLFESRLEPRSFDLIHARYQIAPLGRGREQVASYRRLIKPGGALVLEEWDLGSWHFNPTAPAAERLIRLLSEIFAALGGEAGRGLPELLRGIGVEEPEIDAHVIALKPGHPYLRLPLQFSVALESRLRARLSEEELASLRREAERELAEPDRWGTTSRFRVGRLEG